MTTAARLLLVLSAAALAACNGPQAMHPPSAAVQACPQWTDYPLDHHSNQPSPYLGCVTTMNLRAMAANPADLDSGRPLGPADGDRQARAISAYRQGRGKPSGGGAGAGSLIPTAIAMPGAGSEGTQ